MSALKYQHLHDGNRIYAASSKLQLQYIASRLQPLPHIARLTAPTNG